MSTDSPPITSLRVITLNCWGLKYISTHRRARLAEIGTQLSQTTPRPDIVGLQECWTQEDFNAIHSATSHILPHAKFYFSGIFGGGLAILSRWPIDESAMYPFPLNGRPSAFWRGDWFVGKGVACARIRLGSAPGAEVAEVLVTHLHAPYEERKVFDSYLCHRVAQAWDMAKLLRHAAERGSLVVALGDFNMVPLSLAYRLLEAHAPVRDVWRSLYPDSAIAAAKCEEEKVRSGGVVPSVRDSIALHGATCDSMLNTWRWNESDKKALLKRGKDREVDLDALDDEARRLDYVFLGTNVVGNRSTWATESAEVGMTMRHPTLRCSLSDHFSVHATLTRQTLPERTTSALTTEPMVSHLPVSTYEEILSIIKTYTTRELGQRRWRLAHFGASVVVSIGCLIAVWWSPRNFVAFLLMLLSTLGLGAGVIDGLIGGLFVGSEIRALKEFEWEIVNARDQAIALEGRVKGVGA